MTSTKSRSGEPGALRGRPQLSDEVAGHLRGLITSCRVQPGDFIRLDETAAELGVSVTPVREALLTLRGEGLVELVPQRGYVVSALRRDDVTDLFWLQGQIAEKLAIRASKAVEQKTLEELTTVNRQLARAVENGDAKRIELLEFDFHRILNLSSGASKLSWFLLNATRYTPARFYSADHGWGAAAVASHTRLITALANGDAKAAADETRAHFDDGAKRLVTHLETTGMWD